MTGIKKLILIICCVIIALLAVFYIFDRQLLKIYNNQASAIFFDRNNRIITIIPNQKGYYNQYQNDFPKEIFDLLVQKEDRFFYLHPGINPVSSFKALLYNFGIGSRKASSTITQQLTKMLLGNELKRNLKNKIIESIYSLALETFHSKKEILVMYANSIYFGNKIQGVNQASQSYFNISPDLLDKSQIVQLLASISNPLENNPAKNNNIKESLMFSSVLGLDIKEDSFIDVKTTKNNLSTFIFSDKAYFEISSMYASKEKINKITLDKEINEKVRNIMQQKLNELVVRNADNAAVIVIKLPENEILAAVGSPDPYKDEKGFKINMILQPRQIGSTIKPFIYLKGFENGLRPYTLVNDREYKYITEIGFPLYPKNFDYQYREIVNLHYALSNSLNVPSLKVLEYIGLEQFYSFLTKDLQFKPIQHLENYQLGIALGGLEMSLFDLCKYFTIFPNKGYLKDLSMIESVKPEIKIADEKYIQLVNKILNDRTTGIEQFGLKSDLNLFQNNYALKTGTSRDYKDSWVIGFTPDFLVGVWVGNADNSSTLAVSGQIGAGKIWQQTMELLLNSEYNKKTDLDFDLISSFNDGQSIQYGLSDDNIEKSKNIILDQETSLITSPHDGDVYLLEENAKIKMEAEEEVRWFINDKLIGDGKDKIISIAKTGQYSIEALRNNESSEKITIFVID